MASFSGEPSNSRPTQTIENYLMSMHVMERDQGEIVAARLADVLSVAPATVAMTLKRMERDLWITGKGSRKGIHLTETGRSAAHSVVRRHMLTEWMLLTILKLPIDQIHSEAHKLEHAISPQLEARLVEILEDPKVCPHGNPFPGCEEKTRAWSPLTEMEPADQLIIHRVHELAENDQDLLGFLIQKKILPGSRTEVIEKLPFNQTLTILLAGSHCTLGYSVARLVYVEKIN